MFTSAEMKQSLSPETLETLGRPLSKDENITPKNKHRSLLRGGFIAFTIIAIVALSFFLYNHRSNFGFGASKQAKISSDTLIFDEEFDSFDLSLWKHEITASGGGNWEFEYYTNNRSNSWVDDGVLYLKPTLTNNTFTAPNFLQSGVLNLWGGSPADMCTGNQFWGCERTGNAANVLNPVQSARIRTAESFSFKYGRIEVRAQLPSGDWIWPAIWLLPRDNAYGNWPASGEIDLIESRGNAGLQSGGSEIGASAMGTTLHWGPYWGTDQWAKTTEAQTLSGGKFSDDFHTWVMDWTPDGFTTTMDDAVYFTVNTPANGYWGWGEFDTKYPFSDNPWAYTGTDAPFDKEFYFVMNVAVGGTGGYFPDGAVSTPGNGMPSYGKPWSDTSSSAYSEFWNARDNWYPTWQPFVDGGKGAAMKVDYIKVYEYQTE